MLLVLLNVPQAAPLHPVPERLQVTPLLLESFVKVAVNCCVAFTATLAAVGETETVIAAESVMETVAAENFEESATAVAMMVTVDGLGKVAGAV